MEGNQYAKYNYKAKLKSIQNNFLNITGVPFFDGFTLSTSLNLIRLIFMWTIIKVSCRFTEKNFSHYCFSFLLRPVPMDVGLRAIRAPTDTFLVFVLKDFTF